MTQLALSFDDIAAIEPVATIASPLCSYQNQPCWRRGRAVPGPPEQVSPECVNRSIVCLTCKATGVESTNLAVKAKKQKRGPACD